MNSVKTYKANVIESNVDGCFTINMNPQDVVLKSDYNTLLSALEMACEELAENDFHKNAEEWQEHFIKEAGDEL